MTDVNPLASPGIHHITALAQDPQRNLDFYTKTLGLRLVKRTVNFDDPGSYHFYFGDDNGSPGTILTFFPWPFAKQGTHGAGAVSATAFLVPTNSLDFWQARFNATKVSTAPIHTRLGDRVLPFTDPDGMALELIESADSPSVRDEADNPSAIIPPAHALRGFHSATLLLRNSKDARTILVDTLGFVPIATEGDRTRFAAHSTSAVGKYIDIVEDRSAPWGRLGAGIVHHIAVRTPDDETQATVSASLTSQGFRPTPVQDRSYFRSVYLREKGGILFEVATDVPGFATDEPLAELGTALKLPPWLEVRRPEIEATLPPVRVG